MAKRHLEEIQTETASLLEELHNVFPLNENRLLVIGCSTSEVIGERIGTSGTLDTAGAIYQAIAEFTERTKVQVAFQGCEHINRALVVERETATRYSLEEVTVVPVRSAGGAMATYAFNHFKDPVIVEHIKADAGIDIGDTMIGMHLKHVAVPVRTSVKNIGQAHVTSAITRPKLIGGARACYERI